jgi:hypothetical protein
VNVAEETHDPARTFPKALFAALAIAGALYLLVTIGASMDVPTADGALINMIVASRLLYGMAEEGVLRGRSASCWRSGARRGSRSRSRRRSRRSSS